MKISAVLVCAAVFILVLGGSAFAQVSEVDMLLDLLVNKRVITAADVATFRAEIAVKQQEEVEVKPKKAPATADWTERIKWGGDIRFRTRGDWGKTSNGTTGNLLKNQRLQESARGRFVMEAKVNDFTYAGTRFVGGQQGSRSADDTFNGYFNKNFVMFDQYFIRFDAPKDLIIKYGKFFSELKLWTGRFNMPFECSEMVWDTDITTGGLAFQYASPDIRMGYLPDLNVYSNIGMVWVDENSSFNTDPILWGYQAGIKTKKFGSNDTTMNVAATLYDFANIEHKTPNTNSSGTNSRVWRGDFPGTSAASPLLGSYKYEYNVFELLWKIDNERFFDWKVPHGFFGDFIYNASVHEPNTNKGAQAGVYIGKNKLKVEGDWKAMFEWRYLERDSVPDFLPDSNFYGFGTYTGINAPPGTNGLPASGGTNGKGIRAKFEYQLLKSTILNFTYYWMKPIKSYDKRDPYNQFLCDVIVKF